MMVSKNFNFLRLLKRTSEENEIGFTYAMDHAMDKIFLSFRDHSTGFVVCKTIMFSDIEFAKSMVLLAENVVKEAIRDINNSKSKYVSFRDAFENSEAFNYIQNDIKNTERIYRNMMHSLYGIPRTSIKDVIFNPPATIVFWTDGTKTVVKAQNNEAFDPEKGLAMAITKKALGNQGNYFETIKKYTKKHQPKDEPKSETKDVYRVYVPTLGWIKARKYNYVDGRKVFTGYIYTNDVSEVMIWKTKANAAKNALIASPFAEVIKV